MLELSETAVLQLDDCVAISAEVGFRKFKTLTRTKSYLFSEVSFVIEKRQTCRLR
jgi:hypothetical protein